MTTMPARALTAMSLRMRLRDNKPMIELEVAQADVTKLELDAITNAANTQLRHAGGVAAAIARAGGPDVQRESAEKAPIGLGEAVETTAGDMPARYVIHAATMELGGPTSAEIIARATSSTLRKADELGCRTLGLVAFGTGVGGFPLEDAARLMVDAVRQHQAELAGKGGVRSPRRRGRTGVSGLQYRANRRTDDARRTRLSSSSRRWPRPASLP